MDEIIGYDEYEKDFEEQATEPCKSAAESMALSVFEEFTADMQCFVYLDGEQTRSHHPVRFTFDIAITDGEPLVSYAGFY